MDDEREYSPWRLWLSAGLMVGFAALGLSLLFSASDRSTVASVRSATQVSRPVEATPATSVVAKPIEQVQAGERVLSRDEHTGELVFRPVAQTFVRTSDHLRLLTFRTSEGVDEKIETTDEHPFWVEGTGWTAAKSLQAGQRLTEPDGSITTVVASARVDQPDGVTVYNFEVEDTHSYFVAARGSRGPPVWVHNADGYDDAGEYLYRGVNEYHPPQLEEARRGIARPRGTLDDPRKHHGGLTDQTALTSWDTNPTTAIDSALDYGYGVVLRIRRDSIDSSRLRILAPEDIIYEQTEVMIKDVVENADVLDPSELIRIFGR
jgi:hypothetical protein